MNRSYKAGNVLFLSRQAIRHLHRTKSFDGCNVAAYRQKFIRDQMIYILTPETIKGKDDECKGRFIVGE